MLFLFEMLYSLASGMPVTSLDATDICIVAFSALTGLFCFGAALHAASEDEGWGRALAFGMGVLMLLGGGIAMLSAVVCLIAIAIAIAIVALPVLGGMAFARRFS